MSNTRCYALGVMGVQVGKDDWMTFGVSPLENPTWKHCYWCHVLEKHGIRMAKPHSVELLADSKCSSCWPTVSPMWKNNSIDREWPVLTVRVDWAQVTFLKQNVVFFRALRVKVRCAQCHAKLNPGGAGIWLATWDFQLHLVESNFKNGSRKPKLYFNTINFNNLFVPDNCRRLGQISGDQLGEPIIDSFLK